MLLKKCAEALAVMLFVGSLLSVNAQNSEFTYQGSLKDGPNAANGSYDFEFLLFDAGAGGAQQGPMLTRNSVTVTNGNFAVSLDFGNQFPGTGRFLEIRTRQSGGGGFTILNPRQPINSTPYAIKSVNADTAANATSAATASNALQLGGVAASQYVITTDPRMSDARPPTAGSASYIQNGTVEQPLSNFSISGNGTAAQDLYARRGMSVDAAGAFDGNFNSLGTLRFGNIGLGSGEGMASKRTVGGNRFGLDLYTGTISRLSIANAGNVGIGISNPVTRLHVVAGAAKTTVATTRAFSVSTNDPYTAPGNPANPFALDIRLVGAAALANRAAFFQTTDMDTADGGNILLQPQAGNVGIGTALPTSKLQVVGESLFEGAVRVNGSVSVDQNGQFDGDFLNNQFRLNFGNVAGNSGEGIGSKRTVGGNRFGLDLFTNRVARISITTGGNVGVGTDAPGARLHVSGGGILLDNSQGLFLKDNVGANKRALIADGSNFLRIGSGGAEGFSAIRLDVSSAGVVMAINDNGNVGIGTEAPDQRLSVNGNASKVGGGSWAVFSDERLKNVNGRFTRGLGDLMRLNPIRFEYKSDNALGLRGEGEYVGFSAQEVERVLPEAVTRSANGYLQINNDPIIWTTLNAVKEQQEEISGLRSVVSGQQNQIEAQAAEIKRQKQDIEALRILVCAGNKEVPACRK